MKVKKYKNKYTKKVNQNYTKKKEDFKWIIKITLIAFGITLVFSLFTETVIPKSSLIFSLLIVIFFILLGVIFDMIGIAVTVSKPEMFNSMATKKIKGAKASLKLMKNASKVSSFCNDVIGDICGILSGSAGVPIAITIASYYHLSTVLVTLIITSLISALTIGGKALGKSVAINEANNILFKFANFLIIFNKKLDK